MSEEEKPLFKPGKSLIGNNIMFICNINDELSLWQVDATLRVYVADSIGVWLDTKSHLMRQVEIATQHRLSSITPDAFRTATTIARNAEALAVYMDMLRGKVVPT